MPCLRSLTEPSKRLREQSVRRFSRTAGGTTTEFLYAGSQVLLEKQGSSFTATYTYGNDLVRKDTQYPMYDGIGLE